MKKIATREGCGDWLAEGVMRASRHIGGEAADAAIYGLKGHSPRSHDHRGRWAEMFDTCTSSTGTIEVTFGGVQTERLGLGPTKDRFAPDRDRRADDGAERLAPVRRFTGDLPLRLHQRQQGVETVAAITGYDIDLPEALQDRAADLGPAAGLELPARPGPIAGAALDALRLDPDGRPGQGRQHHGALGLDGARFREQIGFDAETGLPLPATLRTLDLES